MLTGSWDGVTRPPAACQERDSPARAARGARPTSVKIRAVGREPDADARRVVITGFMCAGKTSVARSLARRLSLPFLDLDELVTAREGRTPQQLIDDQGEPAFRDAE